MLGLLATVAVFVLVLGRVFDKDKGAQKQLDLKQYNQDWIDFVAGYACVAQSPKEKALVQRMLDDTAAQHLGHPSIASFAVQDVPPSPQSMVALQPKMQASASQDTVEVSERARVQIDNTSLLLYFDAYLFAASSGLFVAFGKANGVVRTSIVLFASMVLYSAGVWLQQHRPKLQQAGQHSPLWCCF